MRRRGWCSTRRGCPGGAETSRGRPVLTNRMAVDIAVAGKQLTKLFKNNKLDIEWVYAGSQLSIVQARPLVGL
jgi:hypothetical protein